MQTVVFFDIDSTLVENRFSWRALGQLLAEIAPHANKTVQELAREMGEENEKRQKTDPDNLLTMDWDDIIEQMAKQYGVTLSEKGIVLWERYANREEVDVLDNAPQVLATLRARGYHLAIATKGLSKYQDSVLRVTELAGYFDAILTPDKTGYLKTSPAYFDGYRTGELATARFIQVGDHYYDDVMCAKRNGFMAIMRLPLPELAQFSPFERPQHLAHLRDSISTYPKDGTDLLPDAVVLSLEEVPFVIDAL